MKTNWMERVNLEPETARENCGACGRILHALEVGMCAGCFSESMSQALINSMGLGLEEQGVDD